MKHNWKATNIERIVGRAAIGLAIVAIGWQSTPAGAQVQAGGPPPDRPGGQPRPGARPNIPMFDRELAQSYIDNIDQGQNAMSLHMGLFMRRGGKLSVDDAFTMLKEARDKEPVGSKKWLLIQSVLGFGGYQTPDTADISNEAYAAIFDHAGDAAKVGASTIVEQALSSYLSTVQNQHGLRRGDNSTSPEVLLKAFEAYLDLPPNPNALQPFELQWEQALRAIGGEKLFVAAVERRLKEPGADKNYRLLRAAASAYDRLDPERAIELLQQARPLVPRGDSKLVTAFYEDLVRLMATNDQLPGAILAQQELIKITGEGTAPLLVLYDKAGDTKAFDATVAALLAPDASELDLVGTAGALRTSARGGGNRIWATAKQLHTAYLAGERKRMPELELRARLTLGHMLISENKPEEAKVVLTFDHLKPPFESIEARRSYVATQRLLASLNRKPAAPQP